MTIPHPLDEQAADEPDPRPGRVDVQAARDLLARAMKFLSRCQSDPAGAIEDDDPTELIEGLRGLELRYLRGTRSGEEPPEDETQIRRSA